MSTALFPKHESARLPDQHEDQQQRQRNAVLPAGVQLPDAEIFDETENKAAKHRAGNVADSADDRSDNGFKQPALTHRRKNVVFKGHQPPGNSSEARRE